MRVWVVDDDDSFRRLIERWLSVAGIESLGLADAEACRDRLEGSDQPGVVLLDLHLPGEDGLGLLGHLRRLDLPVVMLTADSGVEHVVEAMRLGAHDYVTKPPDRRQLLEVVRGAMERAAPGTESGSALDDILGSSSSITALREEIRRFAPSDATVLVRGESGTGKELVARGIHALSGRHRGPFVGINSAAIPAELQESELFGHERGAFTGAIERRIGRFEQAAGGTLFLDEVAELSPALQAKLLRVLQERRFFRLGGNEEIVADVRIVAASHRDLESMASFRRDLFFRLAVLEIEVPALRERPGDIRILARAFASRRGLELASEAITVLTGYGWPGNVRELDNAIERASALTDRRIEVDHLPARIRGTTSHEPSFEPQTPRSMDEIERDTIERALRQCDGNVSEVIRVLGIPRTTLYRKLKKYGIR